VNPTTTINPTMTSSVNPSLNKSSLTIERLQREFDVILKQYTKLIQDSIQDSTNQDSTNQDSTNQDSTNQDSINENREEIKVLNAKLQDLNVQIQKEMYDSTQMLDEAMNEETENNIVLHQEYEILMKQKMEMDAMNDLMYQVNRETDDSSIHVEQSYGAYRLTIIIMIFLGFMYLRILGVIPPRLSPLGVGLLFSFIFLFLFYRTSMIFLIIFFFAVLAFTASLFWIVEKNPDYENYFQDNNEYAENNYANANMFPEGLGLGQGQGQGENYNFDVDEDDYEE
jgi:uncharacterized membrane protein